ncbi:MAG: MmcQ/YjbR family DNA-binding protein [Chloroflexota bacterium]
MPSQEPIDVTDRLRAIALALPEAHEEVTWGSDLNFRVRDKIFCFPGETAMTIKVPKDQLVGLLDDPRFRLAAYVGRFGWLTMELAVPIDWEEVRSLVVGSYRLIAPKSLAKLVG